MVIMNFVIVSVMLHDLGLWMSSFNEMSGDFIVDCIYGFQLVFINLTSIIVCEKLLSPTDAQKEIRSSILNNSADGSLS